MPIVPALPYTLTNGQTADADQVMADLNAIKNGVNANAAANGANSDITSLTGLTTPLPVAEGGTAATTAAGARTSLGLGASAVEGLADNVVAVSGSLHATNTNQVAVVTSSGNYTVPANVTSGTVIKVTAFGGGGAGGSATTGPTTGSGGGSGGGTISYFTGWTAGQTVAVVIGTAGTGSAGASGGTGGTTTVTYNAVAIISCTGGEGGQVNGGVNAVHGQTGGATVTAGASGLVLVGSFGAGAQPGQVSYGAASGPGGGNSIGTGGYAIRQTLDVPGVAGTLGAGGSGSSFNTTNQVGGSGGAGVVIFEVVV